MRLKHFLFLSSSFALAALGGCYNAEFDAEASDAHFCESSDDCTSSQACVLARCVSDEGPHLTISGPEALAEITDGTDSLEVVVQGDGLEFTDGDGHTEGEGFIRVELDGDVVEDRIQSGDLGVGAGSTIDISGLSPGPHRLHAQAMYGDGEPYENPSSEAWQVFFIDDGEPHVAIVEPVPGVLHLSGQDLVIKVGSINFDIVQGGDSCNQEAVDNPDNSCTEITRSGHNHVYLKEDYPDCLTPTGNEVSCNSQYAASLRPQSQEQEDQELAEGVVEADRFEELGMTLVSASLQYNDHNPWPDDQNVEFDQIMIQVVDRE